MPLPRFPALRWTSLLLLASIALTTIGVVEASRAARSQRAVAEHALRDYAGFAAWSYQQHLRAVLGRSTEELLGAVNHGHELHRSPRIPSAAELAHYIQTDRTCDCHVPRFGPGPDAFLAFQLGSDTLGVALNAHPDPRAGWEVDREPPPAMVAYGASRYTPAVRAWINDTISRHVHAGGEVGRFPLIVAHGDEGSWPSFARSRTAAARRSFACTDRATTTTAGAR